MMKNDRYTADDVANLAATLEILNVAKINLGPLIGLPTLREMYAGMAMQGVLASEIIGHTRHKDFQKRADDVAAISVRVADALIAELTKSKEPEL